MRPQAKTVQCARPWRRCGERAGDGNRVEYIVSDAAAATLWEGFPAARGGGVPVSVTAVYSATGRSEWITTLPEADPGCKQ